MEKKVEQIVQRMKKCLSDIEIGDGATLDEIELIENKLNVIFPDDYKYFLHEYGYLFWEGTGILGICHDDDLQEYFSMPYFTESDRKNTLPDNFMPRPKNTVVVGPYGGGGHFFLYCNNSDSPGRVSLLLTELNGYADKNSWKSFTDF